ncbi:hypothetical protein AB3R30_24160 [Leptolyngbyaceae cyanobacterium UHCC 1019]
MNHLTHSRSLRKQQQQQQMSNRDRDWLTHPSLFDGSNEIATCARSAAIAIHTHTQFSPEVGLKRHSQNFPLLLC